MKTPQTRKEREVWQAIDSLRNDGLEAADITAEMLGQRLILLGYQRGNYTDLNRFKQLWIAAHTQDTSIKSQPNERTIEPLSSTYQKLIDEINSLKEAIKHRDEAIAELNNKNSELLALHNVTQSEQNKLSLLCEEQKNELAQTYLMQHQYLNHVKDLANELHQIKDEVQRYEQSITEELF